MSRNTEYQMVSTDSATLVAALTAAYEKITNRTLQPSDPDRLFIAWIADIIIQERTILNYAANQNIPSRAEGENLDALGELFYSVKRQEAQAAKCTVRFTISQEQETSILIPAGTRVTDKGQTLIWETTADAYVQAGELYADIMVQCTTSGTAGNGYTAGQINTLIDIDNVLYFSSCANVSTSDGGAETSTDDEYYDLLRSSMDGYSCAGSRGGYAYFAKQVSNEIADVVVNSPAPGEVDLYVLMNGGTIAGEQIKSEVLAACNADDVRPLTDEVRVQDPEEVGYNIKLTYFVPNDASKKQTDIQAKVDEAIEQYIDWQSEKLGRDINPSYLLGLLMQTGIKRVELEEPQFTKLRDGKDNTTPQLGVAGEVVVSNGGYEDD